MSLTQALQNSLSGLAATQGGLDVVSRNIANANTAGYTRKIADPTARILAGEGAGVTLGVERRIVDQQVLTDLRSTISDRERDKAVSDLLGEFEQSFGQPGDSFSISHRIDDLRVAFERLHSAPENVVLQAAVVEAAQDLTNEFNSLSSTIQTLREKADQGINDAVSEVNAALQRIEELNVDIAERVAGGKSTADLQDLREVQLELISEKLGINTFIRNDGTVNVLTEASSFLLEVDAKTISFSPQGNIGVTTVLGQNSAPPGAGDLSVDNVSITNDITKGEIGGLLQLRDTLLVQAQSQLDELAGELAERFQQSGNPAGTNEVDLFFDGTATYATANEQGISSRIAVNTAIVNNTWRLRDGTDVGAESVNRGDQSVLNTVLQVFEDNTITFNNGQINGTFTLQNFASSWIGFQGQQRNNFFVSEGFNDQLATSLSQRFVNDSAVNIDEELAQLIQLQTSYNASARAISTINEAFDQLLAIRI
ncbi:MAG: flagellar hook-associated protein FlgK [Alphaproteobacteria bacterium]|nr:flagellar hook-associated protein FlgK [Alphaproteobacteria bacterium]